MAFKERPSVVHIFSSSSGKSQTSFNKNSIHIKKCTDKSVIKFSEILFYLTMNVSDMGKKKKKRKIDYDSDKNILDSK